MLVGEQTLSTGKGFVATHDGKSYLITNRHNVTGRHQHTDKPLSPTGGVPDRICIMHNANDQLGKWAPRFENLYLSESPRWIEHPTLGSKADFVALPLTQLSGVRLYTYNPACPGPDILAGPSSPVSVIGFPFGITAGGLFAVWSTGFIASEPEIDFEDLPIFLIDCRSRPGQSGSPVISFHASGHVPMADGGGPASSDGAIWKFIGIYSGRIHPESDLGMVWKASAITKLLQSTGGAT
ncbi:trypsin-like peptidase domain-containing protein [Methylolobus aquaticus]